AHVGGGAAGVDQRGDLRGGGRGARIVEHGALDVQGALGLAEGLGEVAAQGHRLADALHGGGQRRVGDRELLEGEAGGLDHDVVQGRLEAGGGGAGDVVADLVEGVADGQAGGELGDREAGGLGGQRLGA